MTSIVVPAHNEEKGIARLLRALGFPDSVSFQVIVVANGCTDATAGAARDLGATVLETPVPSKTKAMALGDLHATSFPRLYVDGDVVITAEDVETLCGALTGPVHAAGPARWFPMAGVSWPVRWYYDIWSRLKGVRTELYGRGVVAVDEAGHARLEDWPDVMSDDMFIAMSFTADERTVVENAQVTINPPKTYSDLLRRRIRVVTGNRRLQSALSPGASRPSDASLSYLMRLGLSAPVLMPRIVIFVGTTVIARLVGAMALRRGTVVWLRDESSRS